MKLYGTLSAFIARFFLPIVLLLHKAFSSSALLLVAPPPMTTNSNPQDPPSSILHRFRAETSLQDMNSITYSLRNMIQSNKNKNHLEVQSLRRGDVVTTSMFVLLADGGSSLHKNDDDSPPLPSPSSSWRSSEDFLKQFQFDRVVRVLSDEQTVIKLEKSGLVSLAGIQTPKIYDSSLAGDCPSYTTINTKLQQLLPPGTPVRVQIQGSSSSSSSSNRGVTGPRKAIVLTTTGKPSFGKTTSKKKKNTATTTAPTTTLTSVQGELIRRGYAKVKQSAISSTSTTTTPELLVDEWMALEQQAKEQHLGPFHQPTSCSSIDNNNHNQQQQQQQQTPYFEAQFEPIEFTLQTDWREDGGRPVRRKNPDVLKKNDMSSTPANPGDRKGCSDFQTYEDALRYYERYFPYYGDVARLDRDGDGVPCPGLPHTKDGVQYRMKVPNTAAAAARESS